MSAPEESKLAMSIMELNLSTRAYNLLAYSVPRQLWARGRYDKLPPELERIRQRFGPEEPVDDTPLLTVAELICFTEEDLSRVKGMGEKSVKEIVAVLAQLGLKLADSRKSRWAANPLEIAPGTMFPYETNYELTCLICGMHGESLVFMQLHARDAHHYQMDDHLHVTRREVPGGFIWTMPDGVDWLWAKERFEQ